MRSFAKKEDFINIPPRGNRYLTCWMRMFLNSAHIGRPA